MPHLEAPLQCSGVKSLKSQNEGISQVGGWLIHWKTDKNTPTGRMCLFPHFEASQSKEVLESPCWVVMKNVRRILKTAIWLKNGWSVSCSFKWVLEGDFFFFHRCEIIWPSGKTRRWQLDSVSCLLTFKIITAATFIFPSQYVCLRPLYLRLHLFFDCPLHRKTITWTPSRLFLSLLASKSLVVKLQDERMK